MPDRKPSGVRIEQRTFPTREVRLAKGKDGGDVLEGLSPVWDSYSEPMWGFREVVRRGSTLETIEADDIRALFNHDANMILGRTRTETGPPLELEETDDGLFFRQPLPNTSYAGDLAENVRLGNVTQCSFSFEIPDPDKDERWTYKFFDDGLDLRELLRMKLYDIGPVTFPAYVESSVQLRELRSLMRFAGMDPQRFAPALGRLERGLQLRADDKAAVRYAIEQLQRLVPPESGQRADSGPSDGDPKGNGPSVDVLLRELDLAALEV